MYTVNFRVLTVNGCIIFQWWKVKLSILHGLWSSWVWLRAFLWKWRIPLSENKQELFIKVLDIVETGNLEAWSNLLSAAQGTHRADFQLHLQSTFLPYCSNPKNCTDALTSFNLALNVLENTFRLPSVYCRDFSKYLIPVIISFGF